MGVHNKEYDVGDIDKRTFSPLLHSPRSDHRDSEEDSVGGDGDGDLERNSSSAERQSHDNEARKLEVC